MKKYTYDGITIKPLKKTPFHIVGQGQGEAYGHSPEVKTYGISSLEEAIKELAEGGYVISTSHFSPTQAIEFAFLGPDKHCGFHPMTMKEPLANQVTFKSLDDFFIYLDRAKSVLSPTLSLDLYAAYVHRIGAKVGRKIKGKIVWRK